MLSFDPLKVRSTPTHNGDDQIVLGDIDPQRGAIAKDGCIAERGAVDIRDHVENCERWDHSFVNLLVSPPRQSDQPAFRINCLVKTTVSSSAGASKSTSSTVVSGRSRFSDSCSYLEFIMDVWVK